MKLSNPLPHLLRRLVSRETPPTIETVYQIKVDRKPKPSINDDLHRKLAMEVERMELAK